MRLPSSMGRKFSPRSSASSRPTRVTSTPFQHGDQVAPAADAAVLAALGKALLDENLHAALLGVDHVLAEATLNRLDAVATDQLAVEPGRPVRRNLRFEVEGGENPDRKRAARLAS
ncbi:MAG TPA: hypothetical protein VF014_09690 [Casimicrobiaceae bacterium]|nr:hypothetical protein [Casimicrobiaceae bacterium]